MIYPNFHTYIKSIDDVCTRISKIGDIIDFLEDALLQIAEEGVTIQSYEIDSGQGKVETNYRNPNQIMDVIAGLERRRNKLIRQIDGGRSKLVYIK
jgi:hypothetical protein